MKISNNCFQNFMSLLACGMILGLSVSASSDENESRIGKLKDSIRARLQEKFTFVRIEYESDSSTGEDRYFYEGRLWYRWETDYPEAEENFLFRIRELTTIKADPQPISLRLTDERLADYPFIYMCDVGWQTLGEKEEKRLREYLLHGGFLWADDFWGPYEWNNFEYNMSRIFPELEWRAIPKNHPVLNIVFPLEACPQIPAKIFAEMGYKWDPPDMHRGGGGGAEGVNKVNFRGLFEKESGRLMVVATHNTDIGDGWEREAEAQWYFKDYSVPAYALGINIIVYAMTH